ncbi:hypothetical protein C7382_10666 [Porphyromonas loveana]|uniref:Uncharacterized protein n=1 Tax=Porphyromonas loveana TaxID=1884669 RepID=A0A2U1FHD5_9PORP|nr:hypothetical protein C7382_10666 [Porphyromonas loveana]
MLTGFVINRSQQWGSNFIISLYGKAFLIPIPL